MNTIDHIKQEIRSLAPDQAKVLIRDLSDEYSMPLPPEEDAAQVEAAWDEEIDKRVEEVENGAVQLLSAEESDRRTQAVFARLGLERPAFHA